MKTKEELAEDYRQLIAKITGENRDHPMPVFAKLDFLAGFQARDEQLKEFVGRMKELSQAMPPNAVSMEIYRALQKIRMRDDSSSVRS